VKQVFADTNYWVALLLPSDFLHSVAEGWADALSPSTRIITSDLVLIEFLNYVSGMGSPVREKAARIWESLFTSTRVDVVEVTRSVMVDAVMLYQQASDKNWSITDCASFVLMRQNNISDALTYDHHFEQAGFRALLRESRNA
jgi:predicted nucleic acid-binding protein